jgi:MOSC domain-containing protein YiiM
MKVEQIFISAEAGGDQSTLEQVELIAGCGIVGDRNFGLSKWPGQNLTLIEAEEIEAFLEERGLPQDISITRRNLVTRGVRLNDLVGKVFWVGAVSLKGIELCEPCGDLGNRLSILTGLSDNAVSLSPKEVIRRFVGRGGLRVDVLTSGTISIGDEITI